MVDLVKFLTKLQACEASRHLSDWETKFVEDIRSKYNAREDQEDLGMTAWLPSVNQLNTLHDIWTHL